MPTAISWTDETWNPTRGCRPVSPGCANCYAEEQAAAVNRRFRGMGKPEPYAGLVELRGKGQRPRWTGAGRLIRERLADPLSWGKGRRIFVDSMSDLFFEEFSNEEIASVFGIMAAASRHTFQVLTKRPERMRGWFRWLDESIEEDAIAEAGGDCSVSIHDARAEERSITFAHHAAHELGDGTNEDRDTWTDRLIDLHRDAWARDGEDGGTVWTMPWPLPNVWIGVSVEDRKHGIPRIDVLREVPAAVHFLSVEPLLEDIGLLDLRGIDWVIAGAESGARARPAAFPWFRNLRDQCAAARVPFFLKQAERTPGIYIAGELAVAQRREVCEVVSIGDGSHRKRGGIIELPYLDGVQHAAFPEVARAE